MKRQFLILPGLLFVGVALGLALNTSQSPPTKTVKWNSTYMSGSYSEYLEQPTQVNYLVLCTEGTASREGLDFYKHPTIHTSDNDDYRNNVWDKGHLAPAANYKCDQEAMRKTFTYLNCALQHEKLNRGVWKHLEDHERKLSKQADVTVIVKVDFSQSPKRVAAGAAIPTGFYKEITSLRVRECYWFPNTVPVNSSFKSYKCPCRN